MKIWYYMEQRKNFRAQKFLIDFTDEVMQMKKIVFKIEHLSWEQMGTYWYLAFILKILKQKHWGQIKFWNPQVRVAQSMTNSKLAF